MEKNQYVLTHEFITCKMIDKYGTVQLWSIITNTEEENPVL